MNKRNIPMTKRTLSFAKKKESAFIFLVKYKKKLIPLIHNTHYTVYQ